MTAELRHGRYVVVGLLGEGTQGQTLDGVDKREGRPVAIKKFDVRGAKGWKDVELAEREANVLQSLAHPTLPRYVEHFEEDGALYLVMERIDGESLAALRKRGVAFSEADVLRFLRDAAGALEYLHGRTPPVIHRDLKPGNVLRRPDGSYAFVDFGAVRDKLRPDGGSTVVGTFGYMAPEQFQGRAQPSSDVYAIGATALAMLTGREPESLPHKGLALDVRGALGSRALDGGAGSRADGARSNDAVDLASVLEQMLEIDPDRRPARIAPLLEEGREERARTREERARTREDWGGARDEGGRRHEEPAWRRAGPPWAGAGSPWADADPRRRVEEAMEQWREAMRAGTLAAAQAQQWGAVPREARREARRAARRARRAARRAARQARHAHPHHGPPTWLMVLFFSIAILGVTIGTQIIAPAVLLFLARFFRIPLRPAADEVRRAGVDAVRNLRQSRAWFASQGRAGTAGDSGGTREDDAAPPPAPDASASDPAARVDRGPGLRVQAGPRVRTDARASHDPQVRVDASDASVGDDEADVEGPDDHAVRSLRPRR